MGLGDKYQGEQSDKGIDPTLVSMPPKKAATDAGRV
jgi:hypothetical protein